MSETKVAWSTLESITKHRVGDEVFQADLTIHMSAVEVATAHGPLVDVEVYTQAELERAATTTVVAEKRPNPVVYVMNATHEQLKQLSELLGSVANFASNEISSSPTTDHIQMQVDALQQAEKVKAATTPASQGKTEPQKPPVAAGNAAAAQGK